MKHACAIVVVLLACMVSLVATGPGLVVTPIWRDGQVLVSFELSDGLTAEVRDTIQSGLPTAFSYEIDVKRGGSSWFTRTLASMTLTASVHFDNLTRRYQLSRAVDGRLEETRQTEDQDAVRRWLTRFDQVPVLMTSALEANGEYAVRVRVHKSPRNGWFVLPWDRSAILGNAKFTFLP
jgi:Domain of unknown function (DUF4390)